MHLRELSFTDQHFGSNLIVNHPEYRSLAITTLKHVRCPAQQSYEPPIFLPSLTFYNVKWLAGAIGRTRNRQVGAFWSRGPVPGSGVQTYSSRHSLRVLVYP